MTEETAANTDTNTKERSVTLYKQLMVAVTALMLLLLTGNLVVSVANARSYLFEQSQSHAQDAATSLGVILSQAAQDDDLALLTSYVDVVFDRGYYRQVTFTKYSDNTTVERTSPVKVAGVPAWFVDLIKLPQPLGQAEVVSGWLQLGRVTVVSNPGYAYRDLWRVFKEQLWLFVVALGLTYLLAAIGLRLLLRPLRSVERQAEAIGRREFYVQTELPKTLELRQVVSAINQMVEKTSAMFAEQVAMTESLQQQVYSDPLTGLSSRQDFDARLDSFRDSYSSVGFGFLMIMHLDGLQKFNKRQGRKSGDHCLIDIGAVLQEHLQERDRCLLSRRSGTDFCVFVPYIDREEAEVLVDELFVAVMALPGLAETEEMDVHIGAVYFSEINSPTELLEKADMALAQGQGMGGSGAHWYQGESDKVRGADQWRDLILDVLSDGGVSLVQQDVFSAKDQSLIMKEYFCRLDFEGRSIHAGFFMPMAERFNLTARLDRLVLQQVTEDCLADESLVASVNIAAGSLYDKDFKQWLDGVLREQPALARQLVLEIPGHLLSRNELLVKEFCDQFADHGIKIVLDDFGTGGSNFSYLPSLSLFALKVDSCFTRDLAGNRENRFFIKSLVQIAHSCGLQLWAEGVENTEDWESMKALGVDGGQGYFLGTPKSEREI